MYCSRVVIILFSPGVCKSAFSTYFLVNLVFRPFVFWFFVFRYLWLLISSFAVCLNSMSKIQFKSKDLLKLHLQRMESIMCSLTLFSLYSNDLLKYNSCVMKTCFQRGFIYKEKCHM